MKRNERSSWSTWKSTDHPGVFYRQRGRERVYAIDFRDADGRRRREKVEGGLRDAIKARGQIVGGDERPKRSEKTLDQVLQIWLEMPRRGGKTLAPGSLVAYRSNYEKHIPAALRRRKLTGIGEDDVRRVLAAVRHLQPATQANVLKVLSGPLSLALRRSWISRSPIAALEPNERPSGRGSKRQEILEPDEIERVLAVCQPKLRALLALAIFSGARQSELLALRWADLDFARETVWIGDQVDYQGQLTGRLKSKERTVYLTSEVVSDLRRWRLASRYSQDAEFVFSANGVRPRTQEWARKSWLAVRERAVIERSVRFHDLRHTFASILVSNGATATELADQLGDSVKVVLDTYAHLFNRAGSEEKLRAILAANYPGRTAAVADAS